MLTVDLSKSNSLHTILESIYVEDYNSLQEFQALSEEEKKETGKNLIAKIFRSIRKKSLQINYAGLEQTKGDITKFSGYSDLEASIKFLNRMATTDSNAPKVDIKRLSDCLTIIKNNRTEFMKAYTVSPSPMKQMFYVNISASLIAATSTMVTVCMDYLKTPQGTFKASFKKNTKTLIQGDLFFNNIEKFIQLERRGNLNTFLNSDDIASDELKFAGVKNEAVGTIATITSSVMTALGTPLGAIAVSISAILLCLMMIREIVYFFYFSRTQISERLQSLAYFIKSNQTASMDKQVKEKQDKIVEKLQHLSEKIAVDTTVTNKQINNELKKDDKDIKNSSKNTELGDILL